MYLIAVSTMPVLDVVLSGPSSFLPVLTAINSIEQACPQPTPLICSSPRRCFGMCRSEDADVLMCCADEEE